MEHGLDERHAKIFFSRPRASQIRTQQDHFFDALCLHGKFRASLFPRRSRSRQKLAAAQNARRPVAAIRESPLAVRLPLRAPRQKTPFYGPGIRPAAGMERSPQPRLAFTAVGVASWRPESPA